jgi:hypothetical protein
MSSKIYPFPISEKKIEINIPKVYRSQYDELLENILHPKKEIEKIIT